MPKLGKSRKQSCDRCAKALLAVLVAAGLMCGTVVQATLAAPAPAEPFKVASIHFETNASSCDMGIQARFDTEGVTAGTITAPNGQVFYNFVAKGPLKAIGGQTEGFLEVVEPQIPELVSALGCEPSTEEGVLSLADLFDEWPAGAYTFKASRGTSTLESQATLTHLIPAGAEIASPADGAVVPDKALLIEWNAVTEAILPSLGPVNIVGYHVLVEEAGAEVSPTLDVDVPSSETSVTVPAQYLKPNTVYRFEVLSTEASGNQTISEGFFCTKGVADCVLPQ
jgi:hypothetical protein